MTEVWICRAIKQNQGCVLKNSRKEKEMKSLRVGVCVVLLICFAIFPVSAGGKAEQKDKIVIGAARSLSGPLAVVESSAFGPIFKMWVDEVNAEGGIYIEEYGKKLPIETLIYDDKSDIGTMTRLLEKLIVEDKVDFVFPSDSTAMLFAAAPVANKYGYILMGMEGGATKIKEIISGLPYFFSALNFSDHYQVPVLAEGMSEWGVKSAAIVFIADLHGVEYSGVAVPELALRGIDIVMTKSVPPGIKDMSPIIKEAKAANVDAFLCFAYPDENILATKQSMELGFNPKLFLTGPGAKRKGGMQGFPRVQGRHGRIYKMCNQALPLARSADTPGGRDRAGLQDKATGQLQGLYRGIPVVAGLGRCCSHDLGLRHRIPGASAVQHVRQRAKARHDQDTHRSHQNTGGHRAATPRPGSEANHGGVQAGVPDRLDRHDAARHAMAGKGVR